MSHTDPRVRLRAEMRLLAASGLFDADYYLVSNPDVAAKGVDPLRHFCRRGWRQLRNPSATFDVWWYWSCYLDPTQEALNPLTHYALVGMAAGLQTRMPAYSPVTGVLLDPSRSVRRICLLAGFDPDGVVDDYVVALARELSAFAEVYYLADCVMREGQLERLEPWVAGSWAYRHGTYDFGSWAALAGRHVGWDLIEQVDELLLVNDSGYLLRELGPVFEKMRGKACDWWGLQATKGTSATRHRASNAAILPIPMQQVRSELIDRFRDDDIYDFHVGSYFVAYRKAVVADPGFRRRLVSVCAQSSKPRLIRKYEVGMTQYLIGMQFAFDTYIDDLYPLHPTFTDWHFELIRNGFPLFKRFFLVRNHYDVPGLADWRARLKAVAPDAPVEMIEANLARASDHDKLHRSFSIVESPDGVVVPRTLDDGAFAEADDRLPKLKDWWAFAVDPCTGALAGDERALFDAVSDDPSVKKIVLTGWRDLALAGENVVVAPMRSPEGQYHLLRARHVFASRDPEQALPYPVSPDRHHVVRLGRKTAETWTGAHGAFTSPASLVSASVEAWSRSGLPRWDIVTRGLSRLPADLRADCDRLHALCGERRLVLLVLCDAGGFERVGSGLDSGALARVQDCLARAGAVLGVRACRYGPPGALYEAMRGPQTIDLSERRFALTEILFRRACVLVTDDVDCFAGFAPTSRPVIQFSRDVGAPAVQAYVEEGARRASVEMDVKLTCSDVAELAAALELTLGEDSVAPADTRETESGRSRAGVVGETDHGRRLAAEIRSGSLRRASRSGPQ